jgi:tetratricopeptide (TPR) repeat protein
MSTFSDALAAAIDLLRAERIDEAEASLGALLARWPAQPDALHFPACCATQGRSDEAVALIEQALEQVRSIPARNNLGNVLLNAGRVDAAVGAYERGVAAGTPPRPLLLSNGHRLSQAGRVADAEAACRRAVTIAPDFANAWYPVAG